MRKTAFVFPGCRSCPFFHCRHWFAGRDIFGGMKEGPRRLIIITAMDGSEHPSTHATTAARCHQPAVQLFSMRRLNNLWEMVWRPFFCHGSCTWARVLKKTLVHARPSPFSSLVDNRDGRTGVVSSFLLGNKVGYTGRGVPG